MSWSVNFCARNKAAALALVAQTPHLPSVVAALISDGIQGIDGYDDAPIMVVGHGHQAAGAPLYNVTSMHLDIRPLTLLDAPGPAEAPPPDLTPATQDEASAAAADANMESERAAVEADEIAEVQTPADAEPAPSADLLPTVQPPLAST